MYLSQAERTGPRRERAIQLAQRYVFNPPAKLLVSAGLLPTTSVIETRGRRSGKLRRTPVGNGLMPGGDVFWIVAEHGGGAAWVRNVAADPRVRVKVGRRWRTGKATVLPEDDPHERQRKLAALGLGRQVTDAAVRAFGTRLLSVRIDLDPPSSRAITLRSSRTAETNALERAAERLLPPERRLIDDPYAHLFVQRLPYRLLLASRPLALRGLRWLDARFPGLHAEVVLRARYVDELVTAGDFEQLVLLGAGYDSTAFRHRLRPGVRIFEVDSPQTQQAKLAVIERHHLRSSAPLVHCPCDFEVDSPVRVLEAAGFDRSQRTLTVWLGVSPYLTLEAFRQTLADVAALTASGGKLFFDYMDPDVIDGTTAKIGARRAAEWVEKRDEPYHLGFTIEEARAELARAGFEMIDHARPPELAERFAPPGGVWCSTDDWIGVILAERT